MRTTRVFHPSPLADGIEFDLAADAARHLTRVLRLRTGDAFVAFDGSGTDWPAVLVSGARARTGAGETRDNESPLSLTLLQGVSRGDRMDWTLQKAVELGVTRIVPIMTARTEVRLAADRAARRHAHWHGVVVAACEQCGRSRVPTLEPIAGFDAAIGRLSSPTLVLDPTARIGLRDAAAGRTELALLVGPEGGLTEAEIDLARGQGCTPVRLGPRVLRTETAGVAAIAALQALYGDLGA